MTSRLGKSILLAALPIASLGAHATTIFSEDFSSGNPVPSTSYSLIDAGVHSLPGQYRVVSNPADAFTNGYVSYFDHTLATGRGAMMFFDGMGSASTIWSQAASLSAGTSYTFSFYSSSADTLTPPVLDVLVDGVSTGSTIATVTGMWTQFTYAYVPTTSGTHAFSIIDANLEPNGNDGALDDISLTTATVAAVPEPSTYALMIAGLAAVGTLKRRRS